jgi:hypothetical protein
MGNSWLHIFNIINEFGGVDMKTETQEMESNLALAWFDGVYTQDQAQVSAELQGLSFENIVNEYSKLYHDAESAGAYQWN